MLLGSLIASVALSVDGLTSISGVPIAISVAVDAITSINAIAMNEPKVEMLLTCW